VKPSHDCKLLYVEIGSAICCSKQ